MLNLEWLEQICNDVYRQGYSIQHKALPAELCQALLAESKQAHLKAAGVGRADQHSNNHDIRRDSIAWIESTAGAQGQWLALASALQTEVNRRLLLGLFSFESHFAVYQPGDFYKKHLDAFKGQANRMLSVVAYLNPEWGPNDGGEMVLYADTDEHLEIARVQPTMGTLAVFLSEEFPHEVLPAKRTRYSIAGWYRVNTSHHNRVDPPQ
jgi:SM-20-related protein